MTKAKLDFEAAKEYSEYLNCAVDPESKDDDLLEQLCLAKCYLDLCKENEELRKLLLFCQVKLMFHGEKYLHIDEILQKHKEKI